MKPSADELKVGDDVYINASVEPKLSFTITEFQRIGDDLLACGEYGCTHVDLLKKVNADPQSNFQ